MFLTNRKIILLSALLLILAKAGFSQPSNSSLQVRAVDQNGDLIPAFSVRLKTSDKIVGEALSENLQEIILSKLAAEKYLLEVEAEGFEPLSMEIELKAGKNELTVTLQIAQTVESVKVELDAQESAVENVFSNFLTDDQIASLSDDPAEMKRQLKQIAGGGDVVIRVDGITGTDLPPKSQIASIRIVRSSFDAENHKLGSIFVDIVTKVGSRRFSGSLSFVYNNAAFNARNPFAERRSPEQSRNTFFYLSGPIVENKTDFSLVFTDIRNSQTQNVFAFLPDGEVNDSVNSYFYGTSLNLRINHNLTKDLPVKINYLFNNGTSEDLGVGGFNLPDRAFDQKNRSHELRLATAFTFSQRFLNEFRIKYENEAFITTPQNDETAIIVLDSFNMGGSGNFRQNSRQNLWLADNLLFGTKLHALKMGGTIFVENEKQLSAYNQNGTFVFSTLEDYTAGRPSIFSQSPGTRDARAKQYQLGAFFQDDIRLRKNFIINLGVRYEWQNNLQDKDNFSPRLGFSWTPFADGKTTFRGGAGVFYNWMETKDLLTIRSQDRTQPGETIIFNPVFPYPLFNNIGQTLPPSFLQKEEGLKNPYIIHTSIGVQHRINPKNNFRAEYVYQKGIHQFRSRDINAPLDGIRPNQDLGKIAQFESSGFFVRNSLDLGLDGTLTKTLSYTVNYSLSKTTSDSGGVFNLPSDNYNLRSDISAADTDQRHRLNAYLTWQVKKGLRLSGIYSSNSPLPYNITTGRDDNNDTIFNDRPIGVTRNSLRGVWNNQLDLNLSYIFSFIDRKGGNSGKGYSLITTSSESGFDFTDPEKRFSLRFFANAENIFNQTNYTNFVGVQTSPLFRKPISAAGSRRVTFGIRFNF